MEALVISINAILTILFVISAIWYRSKISLKHLTCETEGTVTEISKWEPKYGRPEIDISKVKISYCVGTNKYSLDFTLEKSKLNLTEGQTVRIAYDESDPNHAICPDDKNSQNKYSAFPSFALIAVFVGYVLTFSARFSAFVNISVIVMCIASCIAANYCFSILKYLKERWDTSKSHKTLVLKLLATLFGIAALAALAIRYPFIGYILEFL